MPARNRSSLHTILSGESGHDIDLSAPIRRSESSGLRARIHLGRKSSLHSAATLRGKSSVYKWYQGSLTREGQHLSRIRSRLKRTRHDLKRGLKLRDRRRTFHFQQLHPAASEHRESRGRAQSEENGPTIRTKYERSVFKETFHRVMFAPRVMFKAHALTVEFSHVNPWPR